MANKSRARSSTTTSRYKQEYPPPEECIATFIVSPTSLRRTSSESKLAVLHKKGIVGTLDRSREHEDEYKARTPEIMGSQEWDNAGTSQQNASDRNTATVPAAAANISSEKSYLNMEFEDCIEEHPNTQVLPKLIHYLGLGYKYTKLVVYCIFLILIGVPMTFVWACINGTAVFYCVWCWGPSLKLIKLFVHSFAPAIVLPMQVICSPIVDIFARILRQMRVQAIVLGQPSLEKFTSRVENA